MDIGEPNWSDSQPRARQEALQTTPGTIIQHMVKEWLNPDFGKK